MKINPIKKKIFIFGFFIILLTACANKELELRSVTPDHTASGGEVIATFGCSDTTKQMSYKGYIIATADKDTVLSFYVDIPNDWLERHCGVWELYPAILIPYEFSYTVVAPNDEHYVHYIIPAQDTMRPSALRINMNTIKQVIITPKD